MKSYEVVVSEISDELNVVSIGPTVAGVVAVVVIGVVVTDDGMSVDALDVVDPSMGPICCEEVDVVVNSSVDDVVEPSIGEIDSCEVVEEIDGEGVREVVVISEALLESEAVVVVRELGSTVELALEVVSGMGVGVKLVVVKELGSTVGLGLDVVVGESGEVVELVLVRELVSIVGLGLDVVKVDDRLEELEVKELGLGLGLDVVERVDVLGATELEVDVVVGAIC